jgi:hypothetical protein
MPTRSALRALALAHLGDRADPRAIDALAQGTLEVAFTAEDVGSDFAPIEGLVASLDLDPRRLGVLRANPAVFAAIRAALAAAVADAHGEKLLALKTRWARGAARPAEAAAYRDAPPAPPTLHEAIVAYLEGAGDTLLARAAERARLHHADHGVIVEGLAIESEAHRAAMIRALRDLVGAITMAVRFEP